jgi:hypothetical protein
MRGKDKSAAILCGLLGAWSAVVPKGAVAQEPQAQTTPAYPQTADGFRTSRIGFLTKSGPSSTKSWPSATLGSSTNSSHFKFFRCLSYKPRQP